MVAASFSMRSRNLNFWIFVADIGHCSTKRTRRGTLKDASDARQCSISSASVASARSSTKA